MPQQLDKIPVLLITGYLGSGKTTLLNRILTNNKGIRFAVIVNDIGEVNIDASLIQKGGVVSQNDDSLVALQNGCICCSLKMDLMTQLHDLCAQKAFDYIVIEASGICEPAPIAQTLCTYPQMVPQFATDGLPVLDCICSVVDALRIRDEFDGGEQLAHFVPKEEDLAALVIEQIEFSNLILLNKASEVSEEELARIKSIIRAIQPTAEIIETNYCDVDFDKILNTRLFDFDRTATSAAWIQEVEDASHHHDHDDDDDDDDDEHEHHHHDHDHEHGDHDHLAEFGIDTYVYYARRPFDLGMFDEFVAAHWPKNVIRCKGMCYFAEEYDMCYLFEQAGRNATVTGYAIWIAAMPDSVDKKELMANYNDEYFAWDEKYGDRMNQIVFIGKDYDEAEVRRQLDDCLTLFVA